MKVKGREKRGEKAGKKIKSERNREVKGKGEGLSKDKEK